MDTPPEERTGTAAVKIAIVLPNGSHAGALDNIDYKKRGIAAALRMLSLMRTNNVWDVSVCRDSMQYGGVLRNIVFGRIWVVSGSLRRNGMSSALERWVAYGIWSKA